MMSRFRFTVLSLFLDAVFVNACIVLAFLVRFGGSLPTYNFTAYLSIAPYVTMAYLAAGWVYGLYEPERIDTPWGVSRAVFTSVTLGTLLVAAIAFFGGTTTASFARWTILISYLFNIVALIGWRLAFLRFGSIKWPAQRTIILGSDATAFDLARSLRERTKWGWNLIGLVSVAGTDSAAAETAARAAADTRAEPLFIGDHTQLGDIIVKHKVNRLIVAQPVDLRELIESIVLTDELEITIDVVPELYEIFIGQTDSILGDIPLMRVVSASKPRYQRWTKRVIDLVGVIVLLVLSSPLWLFAALIIAATDGRPIFFRQTRVGKNMRNFEVYKFRTMCKDAEKLSGPVLATEDDPRITRAGRILRRYRIDELPQILNILQGDMSFIGPRPERPEFVAEFVKEIPGYAERFRLQPGATGLAQVNGGYATTPERKLKYDLMYLYHQSLSMDLQVIVETLKVVLTGKGAM